MRCDTLCSIVTLIVCSACAGLPRLQDSALDARGGTTPALDSPCVPLVVASPASPANGGPPVQVVVPASPADSASVHGAAALRGVTRAVCRLAAGAG